MTLPTPSDPVTLPDLDLAFAVEGTLAPELLGAAGALADPLEGAERWHGLIGAWLAQLSPELADALHAPAYSLGLQLLDDAAIAELNADWRQQSGPTDVLAFAALDEAAGDVPPLPVGPETGELELGDIVISLETAARQAPEHGHSVEQELRFLASHGLLHLLGWDHPDEASLAAMLARQERLLTG
ncbi:rRNA maturation RNase YbeY [Cyanobium sp. Morenito 9A2]|uniref:rRNA maturation RNase YbeY n=1 Tax=Cyanobium sp. Morenito 9A2 TaxID=2823718 RepID=UPI0020CCE79E|nr:rRNA maturation RNase YbeY [Cyanobium sp. Morenito 9A2]MCP9849980.1 rRNA maturation RNase YbeY [Cyanobium sp. Morenito 9A2]